MRHYGRACVSVTVCVTVVHVVCCPSLLGRSWAARVSESPLMHSAAASIMGDEADDSEKSRKDFDQKISDPLDDRGGLYCSV